MAYSIEIINKNGLKFRFLEGECPNASYSITTKFLKQPLPDSDADDAIIINLGREKAVRNSFQLLDTTGSDASAGTHSSTVETIQEKVDYLLQTFITSGVDDLYTVNINSTVANILSIKGMIEGLSFDFTKEKVSLLPGTFTFSVGGGAQ